MSKNSNEIMNIVQGLLVEAKSSKNKVYTDKSFKAPPDKINAPVTKTTDKMKLVTRQNVESILDGYGAGFITKHLDDSHYEALSQMSVDQLRGAAHNFKSLWVAANFPDVEHISANDLSGGGLKQGKDFDILSKNLESGTPEGGSSSDDEGNLLVLRKGVPLSLSDPSLAGSAYQNQMAYVKLSKKAHPFDKNPRIKVDRSKIDSYVEQQSQPGAKNSVSRIVKNKPGYGTRIAAGVAGSPPEAGSELPEDKGVHPVMVYANILRDRTIKARNPASDIANPEEIRVREPDESLAASRAEEQLDGEWGSQMMHRLVSKHGENNKIINRSISPEENNVRRSIKLGAMRDNENMDVDNFERSNAIKTAHTVALTAKDEPIEIDDIMPKKPDMSNVLQNRPFKPGEYPSWAKLVSKKKTRASKKSS